MRINYVEKQALLCGFSVERILHDYGIDLLIASYDRSGEYETGEIRVQVKATDSLRVISGGQFVTWRIEREDLHSWLGELMPVVLTVYEGQADVAYWLYVQGYFASQPDFRPSQAPARVTVRIPKTNLLDQNAMRQFAAYRDAILAQTRAVLHHE